MKARRLMGVGLIVSAIVAPFLLAAFGVSLGKCTIFDAYVGDRLLITKRRFDPNWPVLIPLGLVALTGIVLLVLPRRARRPG